MQKGRLQLLLFLHLGHEEKKAHINLGDKKFPLDVCFKLLMSSHNKYEGFVTCKLVHGLVLVRRSENCTKSIKGLVFGDSFICIQKERFSRGKTFSLLNTSALESHGESNTHTNRSKQLRHIMGSEKSISLCIYHCWIHVRQKGKE